MKRYCFAAAIIVVCGIRLWGQETSSVRITLYDEERFRFEDSRLSFINPLNNIFIGDSAGSFGSEAHDNISIGKFAGAHPGKSYDNIFIGRFAGMSDTSGYNNVYIGYRCGLMSRSGVNNIFMGYESGHNNTEGSYNTFIGSLSGRENTSGSINTFLGRRAGNSNTTGSENTFLGQGAGFSNETGSRNTYIGRFTGYNNQNGNSNVFIGYSAGTNDNSSNRLVIATTDTVPPLVYGEFDNGMLRLNAQRMEIRNLLENTIIGDSAGVWAQGGRNTFVGYKAGYTNIAGYDNVFIGDSAGYTNNEGWGNVFIGNWAGYVNTNGRANLIAGYGAGLHNTTGQLNVFLGTTSGYWNDTGNENVFVGTTAGGGNTSGSYNTYIGRGTAWNNQTGDSNVFIGYRAGTNELGSSKLYIANTPDVPLIYGDFASQNVIFNAKWIQVNGGSAHVSHEIETDWHYVAAGNPGITDTVNTITSFDFEQQKLKYRTTVYTGGIVTFLSLESDWVDQVGEYRTPCGEIGLIGEFNEWTEDFPMRRDAYNCDLWSVSIALTIEDDISSPADSIVEMKFREDNDWMVSWGSTSFPSGIGTNQYGLNIPVTLDDVYDTTIYYVTFNCRSGAYNFEDLTGYCGDSITDARDGKKYATVLIGNQCWMAQDLNVGTRIDAPAFQSDNSIIEKYCYDNLESNCDLWGGLYQWPELMAYSTTPGTRGICPEGWHVPTDAEFKVLEGNVDSQYGPGSEEWNKMGWRGLDAGVNLRATSGWSGSGNGTDAFGFYAVPGGTYSETAGFGGAYCCPNYMTSDSDAYRTPVIRHLNGDFAQITRNTNNANDGCTLRCVKD